MMMPPPWLPCWPACGGAKASRREHRSSVRNALGADADAVTAPPPPPSCWPACGGEKAGSKGGGARLSEASNAYVVNGCAVAVPAP